MTKGQLLAAAAGLAILALQATSVSAQVATGAAAGNTGAVPATTDDPNAINPDTIVVTGSRIAPPNSVSFAPITSISGDSLIRTTGSVSIGDKLNDLPNIRSTYSQQNSTRGLGTTGLNVIDMYGLGVQRTLVLVNGRRHVAPSILNLNGQGVDINTIPASLLERVDIVTGGSSSIYGSDAIAGVVNFVLKQNYEGIEANARAGVSTYGDASAYLATVTAGKNFAEGRGNVAVSADYTHQSDYYGSQRPNIITNSSFVVVGTDPAGSLNGAAGGPDRVFLRDLRSTTISFGGLLSFATNTCGRDGNTNAAFACKYLFQRDGTVVPETGTRVGIAPNGNFLGGNGSVGREGQILVLQPRQDRVNLNAIGHFEITPAIVPFFEGKYVRIHTTGSQSGPAFIQGTTLSGFGFNTTYERPRLDNPFLSTQARDFITSQLIAVAAASGAATPVITGATRFTIAKNLTDLGLRNENSHRQTYRIVGGVRGDLGDGFHYEVSGNYGETRENTTVQGNLNVQRFLLAMDSTRNSLGQIVCNSQVNASAATLAQLPGSSAATLAADVAACQPLNPFGEGNVSAAARNYVLQDTVAITRIRQTDIVGFIAGDSSKWFELPGGPIAVSIGAEYRRETNLYRQDPLVSAGYTFYNAISTLSAPAFEVKEAFGEIRVPILKDRPFFKELTLSGSGRVSDYKGATGTVYTYNGAADYAPVEDIRFRGTYSHSIRAPNIRELYAKQSANFATVTDPCSKRNIAQGTATRATNCAAAGIPASYDYVYIQSLAIRAGGNPNLQAEKSNSYTFGTVITPRWVPGLTLSVDYYNIKVKNVISTVGAQTIINQCYDSASSSNPFCSLFQRSGAGGGPNGEDPYRIVENSLLQSSLNYAALKARGINLDAVYRHTFDGIGELSAHGVYTHVLQRDDFLNPTDAGRADRIRGELGDPIDAFNFDLSARRGKLTVGYGLRYIGHMVLNAWEDTHSVQGRAPENADYADRQFYPAVWYHSLNASLEVTKQASFYAGIDNLLNRKPPFGLTGIGAGSGIYDVRGRYFYTGVKLRF